MLLAVQLKVGSEAKNFTRYVNCSNSRNGVNLVESLLKAVLLSSEALE